jgi:GR25 family glycosyltransferase involved in LPS biosynthesis
MQFECVLIIEDDIKFAKDFERKLEKCMAEMPDDWCGLWLNGNYAKSPDYYGQHIRHNRGQYGGFGYVIHERWYETLLHELKTDLKQCDVTYVKLQPHCPTFSSIEKLVLHRAGVSTISGKFVEHYTLM